MIYAVSLIIAGQEYLTFQDNAIIVYPTLEAVRSLFIDYYVKMPSRSAEDPEALKVYSELLMYDPYINEFDLSQKELLEMINNGRPADQPTFRALGLKITKGDGLLVQMKPRFLDRYHCVRILDDLGYVPGTQFTISIGNKKANR